MIVCKKLRCDPSRRKRICPLRPAADLPGALSPRSPLSRRLRRLHAAVEYFFFFFLFVSRHATAVRPTHPAPLLWYLL